MTPPSARPSPAPVAVPALELRALKSQADYAACVRLQRETWGEEYTDCVPASVLKVSQMVGGVSGGAFTKDGRLVGFVYGLTGVREGRLIHWSHMLAVVPAYRNHGVGRRLKEYQREVLGAQGIEMMYWTFDPLVARNAHLNLNRLGTVVEEYVPNMYGDTGSELHAFGTDRFVVSWDVAAPRGEVGTVAGWRTAPIANGGAPAPLMDVDGAGPAARGRMVRIEIPADVERLPVDEARAWRAATQPAFLRLLGDGYRVTGFVSDAGGGCFYVLTREGAAATGP